MTNGLSARLAGLADSATMAITARAAALKAAGVPVIGFGAGEPDFPTPEHIVEAARRTAADPASHRYGPAAGLPSLRHAVAEVTTRDTGYDVTADNVTITVGAKGAVFGAMAALIEPGDEVLLPTPYWVTYPEAARLFGGIVREIATPMAAGFKVTVEQLEAARTDRTKLLVFCSPSNPTGAVYTPDEVAAIGRWAAEHGVWVLSDDIYRGLVYGSAVFTSMPAAVPELADRCVIVDGPAKSYAMTGWRVGWLIGPPAIAEATARLQSHSTSNVATLLQVAAETAITGSDATVVAMREAFDRRRKLMVELVSAIPGVDCDEPDGAFYVFPSVEGLLGQPIGGRSPATALELAEVLLEEAQIAIVPGEAFGAPGFVRLSFALGDDALVEGLDRWRRLVTS